jgi:hypothetical protein
MTPVITNWPRCEFQGCRNGASGYWGVSENIRVPVCDTCREEAGNDVIKPFYPLLLDPVRALIDDRLARMAEGYFG